MGSSVRRGARVEPFAVVSAGAIIEEGVTVPTGQIWAGAPAKYLRDLSQDEKHLMAEHKLETQQLSLVYAEETEKTFREIMDSLDDSLQNKRQDPQSKLVDLLGEVGMPVSHDDFEYIEHRIYHDYVSSVDWDLQDPNHERGEHKKRWTPYEHDLSAYPEVFKRYQENYDKYDQQKLTFQTENKLEEEGEDPFKRREPLDKSPWEKKYDDLMPRFTGTLCQ